MLILTTNADRLILDPRAGDLLILVPRVFATPLPAFIACLDVRPLVAGVVLMDPLLQANFGLSRLFAGGTVVEERIGGAFHLGGAFTGVLEGNS